MVPKSSSATEGESIWDALAAHRPALERLRYGSFRGVVKAGKLVMFAMEEEWRTSVEGRPEMR